ncbi:MAG: hypothetical protein BYD32DRAFT_426918 [Podila humilis]|nr:MAG: hypothetical protein BYD32DRAFT_426918 [Podila humilis]
MRCEWRECCVSCAAQLERCSWVGEGLLPTMATPTLAIMLLFTLNNKWYSWMSPLPVLLLLLLLLFLFSVAVIVVLFSPTIQTN